jgi:hypothetical protein
MSINSLCLNRNSKHEFLTLLLILSSSRRRMYTETQSKKAPKSLGKWEVQPLLLVEDVMADLLLQNGRSQYRSILVMATQLNWPSNFPNLMEPRKSIHSPLIPILRQEYLFLMLSL